MGERLKTYLQKLEIYDGETPHSFRATCAITLAISGTLQEEVGGPPNHPLRSTLDTLKWFEDIQWGKLWLMW